ncbi:hypothetical protein BDN72DRAFT_842850 [Pluteus cervinus]|uniref:Uncharacterized protein n=1 Tax=Pluteus cervinus TaxID=181527 RepID=A0ACD3ANS5_9AGAR|nr:hypothetical protein BDN72DRAFT_842850 [Pluteus cervinus]
MTSVQTSNTWFYTQPTFNTLSNLYIMSTPYDSWTPTGRANRSTERRSSGSADQINYHDSSFASTHPLSAGLSDSTIPSDLTSVMTGPVLAGRSGWNQTTQAQVPSLTPYSSMPGGGQVAYGMSNMQAEDMVFNDLTFHNDSPESHSPPSSGYPAYTDQFLHSSMQSTATTSYTGTSPSPGTYTPRVSPPRGTEGTLEGEVGNLRRTRQALEYECRSLQQEIQRLQTQRAQVLRSSSSASPQAAVSPAFQASWNARTEARVRHICALNRAGNSLCAWHDSRRERRAYPPRNAPPGYLNCGCTVDEALFEESLARHQVGSYLPGESVRMDPALRNPLLRLLQRRFGYRDGEFERDPRTGEWVEGEGPARWEQLAQSNSPISRRRADHDRS